MDAMALIRLCAETVGPGRGSGISKAHNLQGRWSWQWSRVGEGWGVGMEVARLQVGEARAT